MPRTGCTLVFWKREIRASCCNAVWLLPCRRMSTDGTDLGPCTIECPQMSKIPLLLLRSLSHVASRCGLANLCARTHICTHVSMRPARQGLCNAQGDRPPVCNSTGAYPMPNGELDWRVGLAPSKNKHLEAGATALFIGQAQLHGLTGTWTTIASAQATARSSKTAASCVQSSSLPVSPPPQCYQPLITLAPAQAHAPPSQNQQSAAPDYLGRKGPFIPHPPDCKCRMSAAGEGVHTSSS